MRLLRKLLRYLLQLLRGRRRKDFLVFLAFREHIDGNRTGNHFVHLWSYHMSTLTVTLGDTGQHTALLVCLNLDGTPATGVALNYTSDNPAVASVDAGSGVLTLVGVGSANITGTGTRGAFTHSDSGAVTVAQSDDFTAALSLT